MTVRGKSVPLAALSLCVGVGLTLLMFSGGDEIVAYASWVGFLVATPVFVLLGLRRLRRRREVEFRALGDDDAVVGDPDGARKTHEYLTAVTSMEARIGLIQRSQPYSGTQPTNPAHPAE